MEFSHFGRKLAARELLKTRGRSKPALLGLLNPVSCVRYFEFDFARRHISATSENRISELKMLDISSPRLLPLFLADKFGARVEMINPDSVDLNRTSEIIGYLPNNPEIKLAADVDATKLPYKDGSFDLVTSISVIEHVTGTGDTNVMREIERVLKPGGQAVLSFPVKPEFENEYREAPYYGSESKDPAKHSYFFQRYYDYHSIEERLLNPTSLKEAARSYYCEHPAGWFEQYETRWRKSGISTTVRDPQYMAEHFGGTGEEHPRDRMGVCCMLLTKAGGTTENKPQ